MQTELDRRGSAHLLNGCAEGTSWWGFDSSEHSAACDSTPTAWPGNRCLTTYRLNPLKTSHLETRHPLLGPEASRLTTVTYRLKPHTSKAGRRRRTLSRPTLVPTAEERKGTSLSALVDEMGANP